MRIDYFDKDIMQPASEAGVAPQAYWVKHNKINGYLFLCVCATEGGWEHISVTMRSFKETKKGKIVERCPTWNEMCYIKELFWDNTESVVQFHPSGEAYVNLHEYCLHLWKPTFGDIDSIFNEAKSKYDKTLTQLDDKGRITEDEMKPLNTEL